MGKALSGELFCMPPGLVLTRLQSTGMQDIVIAASLSVSVSTFGCFDLWWIVILSRGATLPFSFMPSFSHCRGQILKGEFASQE